MAHFPICLRSPKVRPGRFAGAVLVVCLLLARIAAAVEQWDMYEISLPGPTDGNPFVDVSLQARFTLGDQTLTARGFYDGNGTYRIRFMPQTQGAWRYETISNRDELNGKTGEFTCTAPSPTNHGPVRVSDRFHFAHLDGTRYLPFGTTCYGWTHQIDELQDQTLATLKASAFNKIRICVLPRTKSETEPVILPFETLADGNLDFTRFNVAFFQNLDRRVAQLRDADIQADIILFHPYGNRFFGFANMDAETDDRYVRYVVARLAAYRNVWWAIGNEYDLLRQKRMSDWDRFFQIVQSEDPSGHLRSIHQAGRPYDMSKPWVTHISAQNPSAVADFGRAPIFRQLGGKPVVFDEVRYEGDISARWGNLTGQEMVHRYWIGTIGGTYVGHGECLVRPDGTAWLGQGGTLSGQSPARIAFLRKILEDAPLVNPIDVYYRSDLLGRAGQYYLLYFAETEPANWEFALPRNGVRDGMSFKVDVIDTWEMTITPVDHPFTIVRRDDYTFVDRENRSIPLPGKPWMALRIRRVPELDAPTTAPN